MSSSLSIPHKSGSFIVPKKLLEDDSTVLLDLYDWNGQQNPQHPLFCYQDGSETRVIAWKEAVDATHRAAYYFEARTRKSENGQTIVAILANTGAPFKVILISDFDLYECTDTITYSCSIIGLLRAGLVIFPISTRNSPDAVHHLLTVTRAQLLLISNEPMILSLAQAALKDGMQTSVILMPVFEVLFASDLTEPYPRGICDPNALTVILHSSGIYKHCSHLEYIDYQHLSGSTAFPKPIYRDGRRIMEWTLAPCGSRFPVAYPGEEAHSIRRVRRHQFDRCNPCMPCPSYVSRHGYPPDRHCCNYLTHGAWLGSNRVNVAILRIDPVHVQAVVSGNNSYSDQFFGRDQGHQQ